ncbi:MAG: TrmH family RNA methyltransferase [Minisyncoccia bacterium]
MREAVLILHNIRSATNVGAIFRTSDGAGVRKIYISGYTPTPITRFGVPQKDIAKSALGAEKFIPWESTQSPSILIKKLKAQGFQVVCVEQDVASIDYRKVCLKERVVFMFGNEVRGISKQLLKHADCIAEVPMVGRKESLNVATTAGIVLFRLLQP